MFDFYSNLSIINNNRTPHTSPQQCVKWPMGGHFYKVCGMLKQPTTYKQQIEKLREHGCIIPDEAFCKSVLAEIGYYRLSAYFLPYRTANGDYRPGTNFEHVYSIYEFDKKLRRNLFSMLEELEVYLRAQISYFHAHKYGSDGYLNPANFNNRHNNKQFNKRINELLRNNSKATFVKHHMAVYSGNFPLWVISELFTFGMLSYFFADMITADQKHVAFNSFNTTVVKMKSWLRCCTDLRNLCAHYSRLYYRVFPAVPVSLPNVNQSNENSVFAAIMALHALYTDTDKWNGVFMPSLLTMFYEHRDVIENKHIGFPDDWVTLLRK